MYPPLICPMDGWCAAVFGATLPSHTPSIERPQGGATPGDSPVEMIPAHGHLEFGRHKREVTTWWDKVFASMGGAGMYNALTKVDEFGELVDSWINKTSADVGFINEELRKILFEQEIIKQRQERMMMVLTGLCDVTGDKSLCCTYMNNLTKPSEDLEVPDYYDIIKGHQEERAKLQTQMRRLGDSWNPLSGIGGWFGSFWDSVMGFFKKAGMILIMTVLLGIAIYATIKFLFYITSKVPDITAKIKSDSELKETMAMFYIDPLYIEPEEATAMFYTEHTWYSKH